jgi:hypothetical protein
LGELRLFGGGAALRQLRPRVPDPAARAIGSEIAARRSTKLTFWEYTKLGSLITLLSLFIGGTWIELFIWQ